MNIQAKIPAYKIYSKDNILYQFKVVSPRCNELAIEFMALPFECQKIIVWGFGGLQKDVISFSHSEALEFMDKAEENSDLEDIALEMNKMQTRH